MAKFLFFLTAGTMVILGYAAVTHAPLPAIALLALLFVLLALSTLLAYFDGNLLL